MQSPNSSPALQAASLLPKTQEAYARAQGAAGDREAEGVAGVTMRLLNQGKQDYFPH